MAAPATPMAWTRCGRGSQSAQAGAAPRLVEEEAASSASPAGEGGGPRGLLALRVVDAEQARDRVFLQRLKNQCKEIVAKVSGQIKAEFGESCPVDGLHVFLALANRTLETQASWMTTRLEQQGKQGTSLEEVRKFVGTFLHHQINCYDLAETLGVIREFFAKGFKTLTAARYTELAMCVSAQDPLASVMPAGLFEATLFQDTRTLAGSQSQNIAVESAEEETKVVDALTQVILGVRYHRDSTHLPQARQEAACALVSDLGGSAHGTMATGSIFGERTVLNHSLTMSVLAKVEGHRDLHPFVPLGELLQQVARSERKQRKLSGPKQDTVANVVARARELGLHVNAELVVNDTDKVMGTEIVAVKTSLGAESGDKNLQAVAIWGSESDGGNRDSWARFIESDTGIGDQLTNTLCSDPLAFLGADDVLFFRSEDKDDAAAAVEDSIKTNSNVLTYGKLTADWIVAQKFCISSSVTGSLASLVAETRRFLEREAGEDRSEAGMESDADSCESVGSFEASQSGDLDGDALLRAGAKVLASAWLFPRTSRKDSKALSPVLRPMSWCRQVYQAGLLTCKAHPFLAASGDGLAVVVPPNATLDEPLLTGVELGTTLARGKRVARDHGGYLSCSVGERLWWEAVPRKHRARLIHQAVVLDLNYVLFVDVSGAQVVYACLVNVPQEVRSVFKKALLRFSPLVSWAHSCVVENWKGEMPNPPLQFEEQIRARLRSHLPLWQPVMRRIRTAGPFHPVRAFRSLAQVLHESLQSGLCPVAQRLAQITAPDHTDQDMAQQVAFQGIRQLVSNAYAIFCVISASVDHDGNFAFEHGSLRSFREACDKTSSFSSFATGLATSLLLPEAQNAPDPDSKALSGSMMTEVQASEIRKERPRLLKASRKFFDEGKAKRLRLCTELRHEPVSLGTRDKVYTNTHGKQVRVLHQASCVVCNGQASYRCDTCGVVLHNTFARKNSNKRSKTHTCWTIFHTKDSLEAAVADAAAAAESLPNKNKDQSV